MATPKQEVPPKKAGPLPNWITVFEGKDTKGRPRVNEFIVDPDIFYPGILRELGAERGDQYINEIAFAVMKLDFDLAVRQAKVLTPGRRIIRRVRGDDGRKQRWNRTMFPPGKKNWDEMSLAERTREVRGHFKRIRGFMPV